MALLIDGKRISAEIKDELKEEVAQLKEQGIDVYSLARVSRLDKGVIEFVKED